MRIERLGVAISMGALLGGFTPARAIDLPIAGQKLVVLDRVAAAGKAKAVFVSRDDWETVTKGSGTDPADLSAMLEVSYAGTYGVFDMPQGTRWILNTPEVAKYSDPTAPATGSVKTARIQPGAIVKIVAKSPGETPIDVSTPVDGTVWVALSMSNGPETFRQCTQFNHCTTKSIASGTGWKLACKNTFPFYDYTCRATTPACLAGRYVDMGSTVIDTCTDLEWEKKETMPGSGDDAGNPHDVDNAYVWAGRCSISNELCQPTAAAEAACQAQTDPGAWADGCNQCGGLDGTCVVTADCSVFLPASITTVWDWVAGLNASVFAGHTDWRLPTSGGPPEELTDEPRELESLIDASYGRCPEIPCPLSSSCIDACIHPVFGPTQDSGNYCSATTATNDLDEVNTLLQEISLYASQSKDCNANVRAVRTVTP